MTDTAYTYGRRVTITGILANILIAAVKLSLGLLGRSAVLVAEAFDSLADVGATTGVLIGLKYASSPKDAEHPHGHGKIESIVALFVGIVIGFTGIYLIYRNTIKIYSREYVNPEWIALAGVGISIAIKTALYRYTLTAGNKLNSPSISANASDHRTDIYRLSGVFVGILFAIIGYPIIDPIAAIIVSLLIIRTAVIISRDSIQDLIDVQMPENLNSEIANIIAGWNQEYRMIEAIGRRMGTKYQVNLKVRISPYVQAVNGVNDLHKLEEYIVEKIPEIQGVDISADVNAEEVQQFENLFKKRVLGVFDRHKEKYLSLENLEFHFLENQQEVHCNMFVNPTMSVIDADSIRRTIQQEIAALYEDAQVIITIQPAVIH